MSKQGFDHRPSDIRIAARVSALIMAVLLAYLTIAPFFNGLAVTFYALQDRPVIIGFVAGLLLLSYLPERVTAFPAIAMGHISVGLIASLGTLALWVGTYLVMRNYPLTRDEHMVIFDMSIFRSGRLAAVLAPEWRSYAYSLVPAFLLKMPDNAALVSDYMPINAALRAAFSLVADPALLNPLLAVTGLLAVFDIARRIFPDDRETQTIVLLLYITSTQVIVTAMTTFAMTPHLALNLVWLSLFLRNTKFAHILAMITGFFAMGLHQVVFHPFFVLPFLLYLAQHRRWRTFGFYIVGYAAAALFWFSYPHIVVSSVGLASTDPSGSSAGPLGFLTARVLPLLLQHDTGAILIMSANLIRFLAWENIALLPLVLLAVPIARRSGELAQPLYFGVLFTIFAMFVLLPFQGHGWGYRYLHGLIGNLVLLAGFGWRQLGPAREGARTFFRAATAITVLIAIPFLLWTTHRFVAPYADVDAAISRLDADVVVVDIEDPSFAIDQVRNNPDLSNRPIRLSSHDLTLGQLRHLCDSKSIAFMSRSSMQALGLGLGLPTTSSHFDALRAAVQGKCKPGQKESVNRI